MGKPREVHNVLSGQWPTSRSSRGRVPIGQVGSYTLSQFEVVFGDLEGERTQVTLQTSHILCGHVSLPRAVLCRTDHAVHLRPRDASTTPVQEHTTVPSRVSGCVLYIRRCVRIKPGDLYAALFPCTTNLLQYVQTASTLLVHQGKEATRSGQCLDDASQMFLVHLVEV